MAVQNRIVLAAPVFDAAAWWGTMRVILHPSGLMTLCPYITNPMSILAVPMSSIQ